MGAVDGKALRVVTVDVTSDGAKVTVGHVGAYYSWVSGGYPGGVQEVDLDALMEQNSGACVNGASVNGACISEQNLASAAGHWGYGAASLSYILVDFDMQLEHGKQEIADEDRKGTTPRIQNVKALDQDLEQDEMEKVRDENKDEMEKVREENKDCNDDESSAYRVVPVDSIMFTQANCAKQFRDGRSLSELIRQLDAGDVDPLAAPFLRLEVVEKRGSNGRLALYSNDNRRLYCLKTHQTNVGHVVKIRIKVHALAAVKRFLGRFAGTADCRSIRVRGTGEGKGRCVVKRVV